MTHWFESLYTFFLTRVFGHYAHPYIITETAPGRLGPYTRQLKYLGSLDEAIGIARRRFEKNTKTIYVAVLTRGRKVVWENRR